MITIKTDAVTASPLPLLVSGHYAQRLAWLLPRHDMDKTIVPFLVPQRDHEFLLDSLGNWRCNVVIHEGSIQLQLSYKYPENADAMESALAHWVVACNPAWSVVRKEEQSAYPLKLTVDTTFTVVMPSHRRFSQEELDTITFEIPMTTVGVFIEGEEVLGAQVVAYSTGDQVEVQP